MIQRHGKARASAIAIIETYKQAGRGADEQTWPADRLHQWSFIGVITDSEHFCLVSSFNLFKCVDSLSPVSPRHDHEHDPPSLLCV